MRRKGERLIAKKLERWDPDGHIAESIATGTHWLDAWIMQNNTPFVRLSKATGIPSERFMAITSGDAVSRAEVDALARAWSMTAGDLIASMGGRLTFPLYSIYHASKWAIEGFSESLNFEIAARIR